MSTPPLLYGAAKDIINQMVDGDTRVVRPEHAPAMYQAARKVGAGIILRAIRQDGELRYLMKRCSITSPLAATRRSCDPGTQQRAAA